MFGAGAPAEAFGRSHARRPIKWDRAASPRARFISMDPHIALTSQSLSLPEHTSSPQTRLLPSVFLSLTHQPWNPHNVL